MQLKPGVRLRSTTCSTEVVVVRASEADVDLRCGGAPMVGLNDQPTGQPIAAGHADGTALGKRYVDDDGSLELLCIKAGVGSLSVGDRPMLFKEAKPLPSSD
ncbi:MAG: hypothetical protein AB1679_30605 [Actinomycetota bacterium]|jgi:hypothetical protein